MVIDEKGVAKPGATWHSRRDKRLAHRAPSPQGDWVNRASSKRLDALLEGDQRHLRQDRRLEGVQYMG
eukprot:890698-Pyramimonas_sp.AAC.1